MQRIISQLIDLLFAVSGIQFAQGASDRAYAVANSKAHFLRCGTKHPTAAEARELVERFHSWKQANAKKPTSNPGNGNVMLNIELIWDDAKDIAKARDVCSLKSR